MRITWRTGEDGMGEPLIVEGATGVLLFLKRLSEEMPTM